MKNLKKLRTDKHLTQTELAKVFNVNHPSISYWENGIKEPDYNTLKKIAAYFDVTIDYLLGLEDNSGITYPQRFIEVSDTEKQLIAEFRRSKRSAQKFLIDLEEK